MLSLCPSPLLPVAIIFSYYYPCFPMGPRPRASQPLPLLHVTPSYSSSSGAQPCCSPGREVIENSSLLSKFQNPHVAFSILQVQQAAPLTPGPCVCSPFLGHPFIPPFLRSFPLALPERQLCLSRSYLLLRTQTSEATHRPLSHPARGASSSSGLSEPRVRLRSSRVLFVRPCVLALPLPLG